MHDADIIIRAERPIDSGAIRYVNNLAFGRRDEADIVQKIRRSQYFVPSLSLVADSDGFIIGHAMFSEATVYSAQTAWTAIVLGPIAVEPDRQCQGIGSMLIRAGLERCIELNYTLVALIGHPDYYSRFGFVTAGRLGFTCNIPVPDDVFMIYPIRAEKVLPGNLVYPRAFF